MRTHATRKKTLAPRPIGRCSAIRIHSFLSPLTHPLTHQATHPLTHPSTHPVNPSNPPPHYCLMLLIRVVFAARSDTSLACIDRILGNYQSSRDAHQETLKVLNYPPSLALTPPFISTPSLSLPPCIYIPSLAHYLRPPLSSRSCIHTPPLHLPYLIHSPIHSPIHTHTTRCACKPPAVVTSTARTPSAS